MIGIYGFVIVLGTLAAGVGSAGLVWYLSRYSGRAGATWFMATLSIQAIIAFAYGVGLLIFDPVQRAFIEAVVWIGMTCLGPLFLGFVLVYTGRTDAVRSGAFRALLVFPIGTVALALTHPFHSLLWREFRIVPVFDLSTVLYTVQPWGIAATGVSLLTAGVGVLLLLETIQSYGPLYRREAIAVALSTVPPAVALLIWLTGVGPWPALNLAPFFLLPHVLLDAYAFVGTHMFETNPTTQRAAERTALDGLKDPMLTVDTDERVVNANDRAKALFGIADRGQFPVPLETLTGTDLEAMRTAGEIDIRGSDGGVFAVSYTPLADRGGSVGGMLVLYDVTEERRRKQQLAVFNRVLRHNLRNEMTVINGYARSLESAVSDPTHSTQAGSIADAGERLLSIANKAKSFDRIRDRNAEPKVVAFREVLESVVAEIRDTHPDAEIDVEIEASPRLRSDSELLSLLLSNLLENAIVHASETVPTVAVRLFESDENSGEVVIEIRDGNDRISDIEVDSLRDGTETQLQHGTGIGLWIVQWCVTALNGRIEFDYDEGNVVTVSLPADDRPT